MANKTNAELKNLIADTDGAIADELKAGKGIKNKTNKNGAKPDTNQSNEIELDKPVQGTTTLNEFQLLALLEGYVNERSVVEQVVTGLTIGRKEGGVVIEHADVVPE